uniref:Cytoplasmic dynein 2 intermediate chain 2 n=1 Tax=Halisarca dujardinii TaxID=2583056 RepID=A0A9F1U419_HALDU|nr:cytoplasmic dynein 2 intermediate chain 2 [Halisarca dujardinii]
MFQDESFQASSFASCWKKEAETRASHTQTSELLMYDAEVQTKYTTESVTQTEQPQVGEVSLAACEDPSSLAAFLQRVEGSVCQQLLKNTQTRAFEDYSVMWEEPVAMVSCIHQLADELTLEKKFSATDLSWNSTGTVLAVSYGHMGHQSWCVHEGCVGVWHLGRQPRGSPLRPGRCSLRILAPSCAMAVACHPTEPALLAAGTFSGELCVWSVASDDSEQLVARSGLYHNGHHEPVSQVTWLEDSQARKQDYNLISLGTDGKVLLWKLIQNDQQLQLLCGFHLHQQGVWQGAGQSSRPSDTVTEIGATCLGFSLEDKTLFLVGGENGSVLKCSLNRHVPEASPLSEVEEHRFPSPITFSFQPHHGPVYTLSPSPFHRNLFLTCSTDASARVYSLLESAPLLTIDPCQGFLYSCVWSSTRPMVLILGTQTGQLLVYDLQKSQVAPVEVLFVEGLGLGPVLGISFNHSRPQVLAAVHSSGHVMVWRMSSQLAAARQGEEKRLEDLASQTLTAYS